MSNLYAGLDKASILYAIKHTAWHVLRTCIISTVLCALAMQLILGFMHPMGIFCAFMVPLLLSTPVTLILHLKNQQLRSANKSLDMLASTDWLTGAANRRSFTLKVEENIRALSKRKTMPDYALLLIDVDNFKSLNDTFGHEAGDITLQTMVRAIREHVGSKVPFARIGGEEFAMFIADLDGKRASEIAKEICEHVSTTDYSAAGVDGAISVSIGVAIAAEADSLSQLLRVADKKMYLAKRKGRNRVESEQLTKPESSTAGRAA